MTHELLLSDRVTCHIIPLEHYGYESTDTHSLEYLTSLADLPVFMHMNTGRSAHQPPAHLCATRVHYARGHVQPRASDAHPRNDPPSTTPASQGPRGHFGVIFWDPLPARPQRGLRLKPLEIGVFWPRGGQKGVKNDHIWDPFWDPSWPGTPEKPSVKWPFFSQKGSKRGPKMGHFGTPFFDPLWAEIPRFLRVLDVNPASTLPEGVPKRVPK